MTTEDASGSIGKATRRSVLTSSVMLGSALTGAGLATSGCATPTVTEAMASGAIPMLANRNIVLVHGAWHGGWCWRDVKAVLENSGARVFTPTLTGLGERSHLRQPVPNLSTHIQDVLGVLEAEELTDVTLVGHSYGGMVITGVVDAAKTRIRSIVYLDAALPSDGQSMVSQGPGETPASVAARTEALKSLAPDGIWMNPVPAVALGIPPENVQATRWATARMTGHPLPSWTEALALRNGGSAGVKRMYVLCVKPVLAQASFAAHAAIVKGDPSWIYRELQTGHDAMITQPLETAALIAEAAI
jgi:pimeloyl-ACP methyl ester carboxylesterase